MRIRKIICWIIGHYFPEKYSSLYTSKSLWNCVRCGKPLEDKKENNYEKTPRNKNI